MVYTLSNPVGCFNSHLIKDYDDDKRPGLNWIKSNCILPVVRLKYPIRETIILLMELDNEYFLVTLLNTPLL